MAGSRPRWAASSLSWRGFFSVGEAEHGGESVVEAEKGRESVRARPVAFTSMSMVSSSTALVRIYQRWLQDAGPRAWPT
jgi:hypothetical protein